MSDDRDPIIDACLEELLGGESPPDVSARVLDAWSRQVPAPTAQPSGISPVDSVLPPVCIPQPVINERSVAPAIQPVSARSSWNLRERRFSPGWIGFSVAVSALCVVMAGTIVYRATKSDTIAVLGTMDSPATVSRVPAATGRSKSPAVDSAVDTIAGQSDQSPGVAANRQPGGHDPGGNRPAKLPIVADQAVEQLPELPSFADQRPLNADQLANAGDPPRALANATIVERVNQVSRDRWMRTNRSSPSPIAEDAWQQRLFLALVGRPPSQAEKGRFRELRTLDQREQLVRELVDSEKYREEFARHWGAILTDIFLPADLLEGNTNAVRDGMLQYFRRALLEGRSYDRIGQDLITATGSGVPGHSEYNGATNFLLARAGGKLEKASADSARLLLGRAIDCQQCHDDFGNPERQQQEFWEWNAFFRQLAVVPDQDSQVLTLTDRDFSGDDNKDLSNAVVFYERPDGVLKGAFPALPGQVGFPHSGRLSVVNRRELLAGQLVGLPAFRRAMTNRVWTAVLGQSLVPLDELDRASKEDSELLGYLADQFQAHGFNLRSVISWTVLSDPFAAPSADLTQPNLATSEGRFAEFLGNRVATYRPVHESLLASLRRLDAEPTSSSTARLSNSAGGGTTARLDPTKLVNDQESIAADLLSGPSYPPRVADPDGQIRRILGNQRLSTPQKTDHLFHFYLHRPPRRPEREVVERFHEKYADRTDLAWSAIQSALQFIAAGRGGFAR